MNAIFQSRTGLTVQRANAGKNVVEKAVNAHFVMTVGSKVIVVVAILQTIEIVQIQL